MKKVLSVLLAALLIFTMSSESFAAAPKPGARCAVKGKSVVVGTKKYTCIKVSKKLVWSKPKYYKKQLPKPTPTLPAGTITTGSAAISESCKLYSTDETSFRFIENTWKGVVPSTGNLKIYFAFVRFESYTPSETPDQWMAKYGTRFRDFYKRNSYSRLEITEGHSATWATIPENPVTAGWLNGAERTHDAHRYAISAAMQAHDSSVDFSKYDSVAVIFGVDPTKYTSGTAAFNASPTTAPFFDGKRISSASTFTTRIMNDWGVNAPEVISHELGHTFGLQDLYAYESQGDYSNVHRFVGQIDVMGFASAKSPNMLVWNRWRLDWLDGNDVYCTDPTDTSNYLLADSSSAMGARLLVVKSSIGERIILEYRPGGSNSLPFGGLVVYRVNQSKNGMGSIKVEKLSSNPLTIEPNDFVQLGQKRCLPEMCFTFVSSYGTSAILKLSSNQ